MPVYQPRQSYGFEEEHDTGLSVGQQVRHGKFGIGIVLDQEGRGNQHVCKSISRMPARSGLYWLMRIFSRLDHLLLIE